MDLLQATLLDRSPAIALTFGISIPIALLSIYRLFLHPLRAVPGPRLAALTDLYGFYYNFVREGGYSKRLEALHKYYDSPVVRIGPNHVHVNSPVFFEEVFRAGSKYGKDLSFYRHFGGLDSLVDGSAARTYRTHIAPLYSSKSADGLVPRLRTELEAIASRLQRAAGKDEVINIQQMFRTLSADMVLQLLFPQDINLFGSEGYHPFLQAFDVLMTKTWLMVTYPLAGMVLSLIPGTEYAKFGAAFSAFTKYCEGWANDALQLRATGTQAERDCHMARYLDIDPTDQKKVQAIPHPLKDVFNFVAGGSDTTAYSTSAAVHYLLSSPDVLTKLQSELDESSAFIQGDLDHKKVQNLPYLNAVVKEALRLSSPVPGCLPRVVPEGGTRVGSVNLPSGTAVSVSLLSIQQNSEIFPEPQRFLPDRWLGKEGKAIAKWNVAFSRGPRQCIGTNIAYLELHCVLAYLFSQFEFELPGGPADLLWVDRFVATNTEDIKVRVLKNRWA